MCIDYTPYIYRIPINPYTLLYRLPAICLSIYKEWSSSSSPEDTLAPPSADLPTIPGRPDLAAIFADASHTGTSSIAVLACGPQSLVEEAKEAAASVFAGREGRRLYFHAEPYAL